MNPKTVAYIHALIIECVSITFEDSIYARALEHESAKVDAYTKMKSDSFKSQLQAVLTTYYEDIKGIQGASSCHKSKVVKRRFEDQEDDAGDEGADEDSTAIVDRASAAAATPRAHAAAATAHTAAAAPANAGGVGAAPADASGEEAPAASTPPGKGKKNRRGGGA